MRGSGDPTPLPDPSQKERVAIPQDIDLCAYQNAQSAEMDFINGLYTITMKRNMKIRLNLRRLFSCFTTVKNGLIYGGSAVIYIGKPV